MRMRTRIVLLSVFMLFCLFPLGCESDPVAARAEWNERIATLEHVLDEVSGAQADVQATIDAYQDEIDALPDDSTVANTIREAIREFQEIDTQLNERKAAIQAGLTNARDALANLPEDATAFEINAKGVGETVKTVGSALPPPWGTVLGVVGGLIGTASATYARKKKQQSDEDRKRADESDAAVVAVVRSVEVLRQKSEMIRDEMSKNKDTIRTVQGSAAPKIDAIRRSLPVASAN